MKGETTSGEVVIYIYIYTYICIYIYICDSIMKPTKHYLKMGRGRRQGDDNIMDGICMLKVY
jgi:hypothetical protein